MLRLLYRLSLPALKIPLRGLIDRLQRNLMAQRFQTFDQVAGEALGLELVQIVVGAATVSQDASVWAAEAGRFGHSAATMRASPGMHAGLMHLARD